MEIEWEREKWLGVLIGEKVTRNRNVSSLLG